MYGGGGGGGGTEFGSGGGGGGGGSYVSPSFDLAGFLGSATPQVQPASGKSHNGLGHHHADRDQHHGRRRGGKHERHFRELTAHAFVSSPSPAPGPVNNGKIDFSVNGTFITGRSIRAAPLR